MIKVRLIIVATIERDPSAIDLAQSMSASHHVLETPHAGEEFRREPDLMRKELNEVAMAEPDGIGHICHTSRRLRPAKLLEREMYRRMPFERLG